MERRATVADPHTVEVEGRRITAGTILIAVGAWPEIPKIPGAEWGLSSNEVFHLPHLPKRIVIVGGGYIAVEFAGIFKGLGATVCQLYRGDQILRGFDDDVRATLAGEMVEKGIDLRCGVNVARVERLDHTLELSLDDGTRLDADMALWATG